MDPLPPVNKAYSMIQRVEKQRQVTNGSGTIREIAANVTRFPAAANQLDQGGRKDNKRPKSTRFCDHG